MEQPSASPAPTLPLLFRPRTAPLAPLAVAARGKAAAALAARLLARDDAALARLHGVAGPSLLLVLGASEELPWADGVLYLGRDPLAPALLVPTALEPAVPLPLLERALLAWAPFAAVPLAVLVDASSLAVAALAETGTARPIERPALLGWLKAEEQGEGHPRAEARALG